MANETTTASLNDLIHSEAIEQLILGANRPAQVHQAIAWIRDASMAGSGTYKFPKWDTVAVPAGTKTEVASFTIVEQTTSSSSAIAGVVGMGSILSEEAEQDAMKSLADLLVQNLDAGAERLSKDVVGLFTSATNTTNLGNVPFSLTGWGAAKAAFKAQNPRGSRLAFVGSNAALRGLEADMRTVGASINANPNYSAVQILNSSIQGFRGEFEGIEIYECGLCPDNDADTISSAFLVAGDLGAIGLAVWKPWQSKVREAPQMAANELYTWARYGLTITNQSNLREVISED